MKEGGPQMSSEAKGLRFDLFERIHVPPYMPGVSELDEMELLPEIECFEEHSMVIMRGHFRFVADYQSAAGQQQAGSHQLEHLIPVDITLPRQRIERMEDVWVVIETYDVERLSDHELNLNVVIELRGLSRELSPAEVAAPQPGADDASDGLPSWTESADFLAAAQPVSRMTGVPADEIPSTLQSMLSMSNVRRDADSAEDNEEDSQPVADRPFFEFSPEMLLDLPYERTYAEGERSADDSDGESADTDSEDEDEDADADAVDRDAVAKPGRRRRKKRAATSANDGEWAAAETVSETAAGPVAGADTGVKTLPEHRPENQPGNHSASLGELQPASALHRESGTEQQATGPKYQLRGTPQQPAEASFAGVDVERDQPEHRPANVTSASSSEDDDVQQRTATPITATAPIAQPLPIPPLHPAEVVSHPPVTRTERERVPETETAEDAPAMPPATTATQDSPASVPPGAEWTRMFLREVDSQRGGFKQKRMCIVQKDDSIDSIAGKYGIHSQELLMFNRLADRQLQPGQLLYIPPVS